MYRSLSAIMIVTVVAGSLGCQSTQSIPMPSLKMPELQMPSFLSGEAEKETDKPVRMAVIWKDSTIADVGKPTTRGFGGRIYFYNEKNEPIKADGELVVYGFDETQKNDANVPDRKYVFRQEELQGHFSESELGPSYSIWLPWDRVGGMRKPVTLLPIFKDSSGQLVKGGQSINVLPGESPPEESVAEVDDFNIIEISKHHNANRPQRTVAGQFPGQQVSHETAAAHSPVRSTTIAVPRRLSQQMRRAPTQPASTGALTDVAEGSQNSVGIDKAYTPLMQKLQELNRGQNVTLGSNQPTSQPATEVSGTTTPPTRQAERNISPFSRERKPRFGQPGAFR